MNQSRPIQLQRRMHSRNGWKTILLAGVLGASFGCAGAPHDPVPDANANAPLEVSALPLSQQPLSTTLGGRDPLEGVNRTAFYVNDAFIYYVYRPIGTVYSSILPRPAIRCINNATDNLEFPRRFLSSLLQAKFEGSGIECLRFLSNTTIGIAGLFDPAWHWFGLQRQDEDFGQAFASWGIGPGCVIQLNSPTNIRDGVGMIFDYALDIKSYFYGGQAFTMLNRGLDAYSQYDTVRKSTFDSYQALKDYQLLIRYLQVHDWQPVKIYIELDETGQVAAIRPLDAASETLAIEPLKDFYTQGAYVDTLRNDWFQPSRASVWAHLSLFNGDFVNQGRVRSVEVVENATTKFPYRYWLQQENPEAPLVIWLPGLGSHYTSSSATALAELCHQNGMAALVVDNTMHMEFVESAGHNTPPGYTPRDVRHLRDALKVVLDDLKAYETPRNGFAPREILVAGYSQGGLNAFFLAQLEEQEPELGVSRYLAINPPVDLQYGMKHLDQSYQALDQEDSTIALNALLNGVGSYLYTARTPSEMRRKKPPETKSEAAAALETADQVPISDAVAQMLVAYSFRRSLQDLIVSIHHRAPIAALKTPYAWGNRQALYDELANWNYESYCNAVLIPYYAALWEKDVSMDELASASSMTQLEPLLHNAQNMLVLHNANDFLLSESDRQWLKNTLGDRVIFFEAGGHLGNLYRDEVQKAIVKFLNPDAFEQQQ